MSEKSDRRVKYTKMVLRESLLDLLKVKALQEISVTELCRAADINRNTFYSHYSIPGDLVKELEDEIYGSIMMAAMQSKSIEEVIEIACATLEENRKMSEVVFLNSNLEGLFTMVRMSLSSLEPVKMNFEEPLEGKEHLALTQLFIEQGAIAMIKGWVLNGFKMAPKNIAVLLTDLINKFRA